MRRFRENKGERFWGSLVDDLVGVVLLKGGGKAVLVSDTCHMFCWFRFHQQQKMPSPLSQKEQRNENPVLCPKPSSHVKFMWKGSHARYFRGFF